jgi:hypothetical protein
MPLYAITGNACPLGQAPAPVPRPGAPVWAHNLTGPGLDLEPETEVTKLRILARRT